jgi:flagellar biosynthesis/type III secretory pathway protein FliH
VHPEDLAACERFSGAEHVGATVRLVADTSVIRGGCLTEGRERIIDGRIDSALERVYRSLAQVGA